jgi:acyl dehydratase
LKRNNAALEQLWFENVEVGDRVPTREFGPLTIVDTVQWAGFQENWYRLHWDRHFVQERSGLRTFIASGGYREALLIRTVTDWIGARGILRKLTVRQAFPTFEGDLIVYSGTLTEKSQNLNDPWIACDLEGKNQDHRVLLTARCRVILPNRVEGGRLGPS